VQVGLWEETVASNEQAWTASHAWAERRGGSAAVLNFHVLEWLQHGYLQQGRYREAWALVDTARAVLKGVDLADTVDPHFVEARLTFRYAAETGRWDTPMASARPAEIPEHAMARARSFLFLAAHQAAAGAILQGDTVAAAIGEFRLAAEQRAGGEPVRGYPAVTVHQVDGLLARARGDREAAIALLTRASELEAEMPAYGPPAALPTLEWLGKLLLEAGRPAEAAAAYERALRRWPNRSASLLGLARARRALGDHAAAAEAYGKLLANWHRADPDLPVLEEVRRGAAAGLP
jgi:tetratricopeptide (TPR) repeat protein